MSGLDPAQHELAAVIGRYALRDDIRCGLSVCRQPHRKGYIVTTKGGCETNIGRDCGKTYLGLDFETMSRQFDRDILEQENRSRVLGYSLRIDEFEQAALQLRSDGGEWAYHESRALVTPNRGCPPVVLRRVAMMVKARSALVTTQREATRDEVDAMEAREGKRPRQPVYVEDPVGEVDGLAFLYPENDFRELVVINVEDHLTRFRDIDPDRLVFKDLQYWARWFGELDGRLEIGQDIVQLGLRLMRPENLRPLVTDASSEEAGMFNRYLRDLEKSARSSPFGRQ